MSVNYIARVGSKAIGAMPLFALTSDPNNYMHCNSAEAVDMLVAAARERGVDIGEYAAEVVDG